MGNVVLRDRKNLANEGIVVAILIVDNKGQLVVQPKIMSRGFVFEKGEEVLFKEGVLLIQKILKPRGGRVIEVNGIRKEVGNTLEEFFFEKRGRRPLVIVDVIQI